MYALSVKAVDELEVVELTGESLDKLQKMVGGFIEIVRPRYLRQPYVMVVNEEGLLYDMPVNNTGSLLYAGITPIVGDVVIMKEGYNDEGEPDLLWMEKQEAQNLADEFLRRFAYLVQV